MEWHNILDPASPELDQLAQRYNLHPLHIEDCRHRGQRAKIEEAQDYLFTVLKPVRVDEEGHFDAVDLDIFLGPDFLITVQETNCPEVRGLIDHLRTAVTPESKSDRMYYRVLDEIVDSYLPLLDRLHDTIDEVEDQALDSPTPEVLSTIFRTKRTLIFLRGVLVNTRDLAAQLQRIESPWIGRDLIPFLRDLYDHVARNLDTVEIMRDLLSGNLDVYLSSVANRTNQVMKVLTVLGTVALPALVISGIYGMNVKGLPGADSPYGIGIVLAAMAVTTGVLLWVLKRFGWL
ncbi:MAG: magnesium and cobalt transport protein CorA [Terriglobia bacterium]|nr:MAG: magnesium and cobalt transport protein CorA [Terriglobia bacterium]